MAPLNRSRLGFTIEESQSGQVSGRLGLFFAECELNSQNKTGLLLSEDTRTHRMTDDDEEDDDEKDEEDKEEEEDEDDEDDEENEEECWLTHVCHMCQPKGGRWSSRHSRCCVASGHHL